MKMQIVMLSAGLSIRMGEQNKMLLNLGGKSLVSNSINEALEFLDSLDEESALIVVTGYEKKRILKEIEKTLPNLEELNKKREPSKQIKLTPAYNSDYISGQFSSTRTGVELVPDGLDFFITLADMAALKAEHYKAVAEIAKAAEPAIAAVRPFYKGVPGHPVYHRAFFKKTILEAGKNSKVSALLRDFSVLKAEMSDSAYILDIDTPEDFMGFSKKY